MLQGLRGIKKRETLISTPHYNLGLGHLVEPDANQLHPGHTVRTYDVNLDRRGAVRSRSGIRNLCENGIGAEQIANFDESRGEVWTSHGRREVEFTGTSTGALFNSIDLQDPSAHEVLFDRQLVGRRIDITSGPGAGDSFTIIDYDHTGGNFRAQINGSWSTNPVASGYTIYPVLRRTTASGLATEAIRVYRGFDLSANAEYTFPLRDLGEEDLDEWLFCWVWIWDKRDFFVVSYRIGENSANYFLFSVIADTLIDVVTDGGDGWNLLRIRKRDFDPTFTVGSPTWTKIGYVRAETNLISSSVFGGGWVFQNLWLGPKKVDGLYQFRQSEARGGQSFFVGAARGRVDYLDETEGWWRPLITGMHPYVPYCMRGFTDFLYIGNGHDPVKVLLGDGAGHLTPETSFNAGIEAPVSLPAVVVDGSPGGNLPAGIHQYRFEYFSPAPAGTGLPGNTTVLDIPSTAANVRIQFTSLPVSPDPKVATLRIYRRDATATRFRRVGEVPNGTDFFEDNVAPTDLGAELPGFPTYAIFSPPPKLGIFSPVGSRMVGAGDIAAPGTSYVSQPGNAEQWDLVSGPTRHDLDDNEPIKAVYDGWGYAVVGNGRGNYIGTPFAGPAAFSYVKRLTGDGPISHRGVLARGGNEIIYYRGRDGHYRMARNFAPQRITDGWNVGSGMPGIIEPTVAMLHTSLADADQISVAYNRDLSQVIWNDKLLREDSPNLMAVFHEPGSHPLSSAHPSWSFHRYGFGDVLAGASVLIDYVDPFDGHERVLMGGPGGFVYAVESGETDDMMPGGRVAIDSDVVFAFVTHQGVAIGTHKIKDYVYHDTVWEPLGNWPVDLEYYFDWSYEPKWTQQITPVGIDIFSPAAAPFAVDNIYGAVGTYKRVNLPSGRRRAVAFRVRNNRLGQAFLISQSIWWLEYMGGEGAI